MRQPGEIFPLHAAHFRPISAFPRVLLMLELDFKWEAVSEHWNFPHCAFLLSTVQVLSESGTSLSILVPAKLQNQTQNLFINLRSG